MDYPGKARAYGRFFMEKREAGKHLHSAVPRGRAGHRSLARSCVPLPFRGRFSYTSSPPNLTLAQKRAPQKALPRSPPPYLWKPSLAHPTYLFLAFQAGNDGDSGPSEDGVVVEVLACPGARGPRQKAIERREVW